MSLKLHQPGLHRKTRHQAKRKHRAQMLPSTKGKAATRNRAQLIPDIRKASGAQNHSRRRSSMGRGFCHSGVSTALQGSPSTIAADQNRSFLQQLSKESRRLGLFPRSNCTHGLCTLRPGRRMVPSTGRLSHKWDKGETLPSTNRSSVQVGHSDSCISSSRSASLPPSLC